MIEFSEEDICKAEAALLPNGKHFDEERLIFIRNLESVDLQAVPGSGKTTALTAKLFCLGKYLPFNRGEGILVISHTNVAVDELKQKLFVHTPNLFQYPNYIGTIQSFVDTFLAIPFYKTIYTDTPIRIDDEIVTEKYMSILNHYTSFSGWLSKKGDKNIQVKFLLDKVRIQPNGKCKIEGLKNQTTNTYIALDNMKKNIMKDGFLSFSDAYDLAVFLITIFPRIKDILSKRFKYVFVDEMQDMSNNQILLLQELFGNGKTIYQKIGDLNQAIYSSSIDDEISVWKMDNQMMLSGSQRLSDNIANLVSRFSLNSQKIKGLNQNSDGSAIKIKPVMIVFSEDTISKVIPTYINIVKEMQDKSIIPKINSKHVIVGWKKEQNGEKLGIDSYISSFNRSLENTIDFKNLFSYMQFPNCTDYETVRKQILNGILKLLRICEYKDENGKYLSKRTLFTKIQEDCNFYELFKKQLFLCCKMCLEKKSEEAFLKLKSFLPDLLSYLGCKKSINNLEFIINQNTEPNRQEKNKDDILTDSNLDITVSTIHGVKGQTFTSLLYLETIGKDTSSSRKYESEKLSSCFNGEFFSNTNSKPFLKQCAKMIYVGFSRPTHLLCFAVQKNRFESNFDLNFIKQEWDLIEI